MKKIALSFTVLAQLIFALLGAGLGVSAAVAQVESKKQQPSLFFPPMQKTLRIGFYPYISPDIVRYQARQLPELVKKSSGFDSEIVVSADYWKYFQLAKQQQLDYLLSPSHFAALLIRDHGYHAIAQSNHRPQAALISLKKSPFNSLQAIHGKRVAIGNPYALVDLLTLSAIQTETRFTKKDFTLVPKEWNDRAIFSVLSGEADVAIAANGYTNALPEQVRSKLFTFSVGESMPGDVFLVSDSLYKNVSSDVQNLNRNFYRLLNQNLKVRWGSKLFFSSVETADLPDLSLFQNPDFKQLSQP